MTAYSAVKFVCCDLKSVKHTASFRKITSFFQLPKTPRFSLPSSDSALRPRVGYVLK